MKMVETGVGVDAIKAALSSGSASTSTVTALQDLLECRAPAKDPQVKTAGRSKASVTKTASTHTGRTATTRARRPAPAPVLEDRVDSLSDKAKYALATETVNTVLKLLTDTLKSRTSPSDQTVVNTASSKDATVRTKRPLQPRSGNATPVPSSSKKPASPRETSGSTKSNSSTADSYIRAAAQCAHVGFSFLRSTDAKALSREMPKRQLENGMLALAKQLIGHGMFDLAAVELRGVKRYLEPVVEESGGRSMTLASETKTTPLAGLLLVNLPSGQKLEDEELCLVTNYFQQVLNLLSKAGLPRDWESIPTLQLVDDPNGYINLIERHGRLPGGAAKSAKQLDALVHTLFNLCPSVASSADGDAQDSRRSVSPKCALRLQSLALRVQSRANDLAGKQSRPPHDPLEALHKCMNAFVRREWGDAVVKAQLMETCFDAATKPSSGRHGPEYFNMHLLLCSAAESAAQYERALDWVTEVERDCIGVDSQHSRSVATVIKRATIRIRQSHLEASVNIKDATGRLAKPLTGSSQDYELLLVSLTDVVRALSVSREPYVNETRLITLAAGFAQRYARSYPGKDFIQLQSIIEAAIRRSKTSDGLLSWVSLEAASIFIHGGALKLVADRAKVAPLSDAWSVSGAAVWLGRILRALTLKAVRGDSNTEQGTIFDDENLDNAERGAILEWQLEYLLELAARSKYHPALQNVLPGILRTLSRIYDAKDYPIRRARVASIILALREHQPNLIASHFFVLWKNTVVIHEGALNHDIGLRRYCDDISARLTIFQLFLDGTPTFDGVKPALRRWQQIVEATTAPRSISDTIDDPETLLRQLRSTAAYFSMQGDDSAAFSVLQLLFQMLILCKDNLNPPAMLTTLTDLARLSLQLGYSEMTGTILAQAERVIEDCRASSLEELHFRVGRAEHLLAIGNTEQCWAALCDTTKLRATIPPQNIAREQGRKYETLHAQAWLIQSRYLLAIGAPHDALAAAKHSVRVVNSVWASLERDEGKEKASPAAGLEDPGESGSTNLAKGVSKLKLTPGTDDQDPGRSTKGAAFWPVVPVLCQSLLHLSDMFAHHGRFVEANYYSEQALATMSSSKSAILLSRARSHRARLLTLADRLEEAELCLVQEEVSLDIQPSLPFVENLRARAALKVKEGAIEAAVKFYDLVAEALREMQSRSYITRVWARLGTDADDLESNMQSLTLWSDHTNVMEAVVKHSQAVGRTARKANPSARSAAKAKGPRSRTTQEAAKPKDPWESPCYMLSRISEEVLAEKTIAVLRKAGIDDVGEALQWTPISDPTSLHSNHVLSEVLLHKAMSMVEQDVTLNILTESTLANPAITVQPDIVLSTTISPSHTASADRVISKTTRTKAKTVKPTHTTEDTIEALLEASRKCLTDGQASRIQLCSTAQTHVEFSRLSHVSSLQSALLGSCTRSVLEPVHQAFQVDLPCSKALEYEERATTIGKSNSNEKELLTWPQDGNPTVGEINTAQDFQEKYVDIIPGQWAAVSLCLNEDCSDLYIVRYRCGQQPLILTLPFARHKPEGSEDDAFDFNQGRAELQEILDLSNYTCHNPGNIGAKGAKTKWWNEREALDRRLHELLINIENIWFGGFKSVFSQQVTRKDQLLQFRKTFDGILFKYLPSRKTNKDKAGGLAINDQILELFIGLGCDDTTQDLDEPLADLLYFVVDLLQFNGERNAYDEIDFDSMIIEVLDALRVHFDSCTGTSHQKRHLILVLDRRLQAFPWESIPCLQDASVSRVGSMLSLRQQILANRRARCVTGSTGDGTRHTVDRRLGTYILNPSSDLPATQAKLQPTLATLHQIPGSSWKSIVDQAPTEEAFSSALEESSMLLYFGHGPGTQYIRPRTVASLSRCSEVVWLMGCSSGAVEEHGELEPCAVPLTYLLAAGAEAESGAEKEENKCLAVVASLWDVTDKDIDRFSLAVGEEWGLWPVTEQNKIPAKTPRKRQILAIPSTPDQVPKTPKTPKVLKTPAPSKIPARNSGRARPGETGKCSLVEAVSRSRDACYLRYLNGAAPVVFGVPVYLGD